MTGELAAPFPPAGQSGSLIDLPATNSHFSNTFYGNSPHPYGRASSVHPLVGAEPATGSVMSMRYRSRILSVVVRSLTGGIVACLMLSGSAPPVRAQEPRAWVNPDTPLGPPRRIYDPEPRPPEPRGYEAHSPPPPPRYSDSSPPPVRPGRYEERYERPYPPPPGPPGPPPGPAYDDIDQPRDGTYSYSEIRDTGHRFFGSISSGMARVIEHAFRSQGRPNGYILGEDVSGAFVAGLRYGEGWLYTKEAGRYKVFWQGPSIGYDAGAEGTKVMVLIYNLRHPDQIYTRFGGVAGSAFIVGGVGMTLQVSDDVVLAPIRAGIGLRLGANIGYLKYTRRPTWNPF